MKTLIGERERKEMGKCIMKRATTKKNEENQKWTKIH
jgi:hypothetical protein